jgi:hypothetical protein
VSCLPEYIGMLGLSNDGISSARKPHEEASVITRDFDSEMHDTRGLSTPCR